MNNNSIQIFQTVALRPQVFQYVINEFPAICLSFAAFWVYVFGKFMWHEYFIYAALFLVIYLFCQLLSLLRTEYVITSEQIIILHGVLSHSTDYVELYRVVDYKQHRSLPQQIFGLKTVTIYSGDRNNSVVNMIGIKEADDVVSEIRMRVEFNKRKKGIYEITNQV